MPASSEFLSRYPNPVFFETGTWTGAAVDAALSAGFDQVLSVELSESLYIKACSKFAGNCRVRIYHGDSAVVLEALLPSLRERCTFWLDAHYSGCDGMAKGQDTSPILRELAAIKTSPVTGHTIMIDDVRLFETDAFDGIGLPDITKAIRSINDGYTWSFETGCDLIKDILVAQCKSS